MKIEINITKRHAWLISAVIVLVGAALFVMAQATSPAAFGVWHPLQLVSTDNTGMASVDADNNYIIDEAQSLTVDSSEHANSYKGCIAVASPRNASSDKLRTWDALDYPPDAVVTIDLVVDGENICADEDGCQFYAWQTQDGGKFQWAIAYTLLLMQNEGGYGIELGQWNSNLFNGEYTNGDGIKKNLFGYDYCVLVDDYDGTNNPENDKDKITLLDGNKPDRCFFKICD